MSDLLSSVIAAHGGLERWKALKKAAVTVASSGELLERKGVPPRGELRYTISLHEQSTSAVPSNNPDLRILFRPERVAVETAGGEIVSQRDNPRASFDGHDLNTKWDILHRAYFGSYAMWIYFNTPFVFTLPGVLVEEIAPFEQDGETWSVLRIALPPNVVSHTSVQKFYFGSDFLLRRQDYTVDIAGGPNIAQYVHDVKPFDGLLVPTKRRAYLCDDDYRVLRDRLLISLDFSDIEFR